MVLDFMTVLKHQTSRITFHAIQVLVSAIVHRTRKSLCLCLKKMCASVGASQPNCGERVAEQCGSCPARVCCSWADLQNLRRDDEEPIDAPDPDGNHCIICEISQGLAEGTHERKIGEYELSTLRAEIDFSTECRQGELMKLKKIPIGELDQATFVDDFIFGALFDCLSRVLGEGLHANGMDLFDAFDRWREVTQSKGNILQLNVEEGYLIGRSLSGEAMVRWAIIYGIARVNRHIPFSLRADLQYLRDGHLPGRPFKVALVFTDAATEILNDPRVDLLLVAGARKDAPLAKARRVTNKKLTKAQLMSGIDIQVWAAASAHLISSTS